MIVAKGASPAPTLIGRFRPLQEAFGTPARGRRWAGSKPLTELELSRLEPGRSWGEIDNSPCYPAFAGVEGVIERFTFRSSRTTRSMSSQICGCTTGWAEPASPFCRGSATGLTAATPSRQVPSTMAPSHPRPKPTPDVGSVSVDAIRKVAPN